jgi:hypothetical protein
VAYFLLNLSFTIGVVMKELWAVNNPQENRKGFSGIRSIFAVSAIVFAGFTGSAAASPVVFNDLTVEMDRYFNIRGYAGVDTVSDNLTDYQANPIDETATITHRNLDGTQTVQLSANAAGADFTVSGYTESTYAATDLATPTRTYGDALGYGFVTLEFEVLVPSIMTWSLTGQVFANDPSVNSLMQSWLYMSVDGAETVNTGRYQAIRNVDLALNYGDSLLLDAGLHSLSIDTLAWASYNNNSGRADLIQAFLDYGFSASFAAVEQEQENPVVTASEAGAAGIFALGLLGMGLVRRKRSVN